MTPDPERVAAVIAEIAANEIAAHFGRLERDAVRTKSSATDLVTRVDEAAEAALRKSLLALAPGAGFIGEEAAAADPSIVAALSGDGAFWVVDPLDGTRNFVNGVAEFGTIVAYVVNGQTLLGLIHAVPEAAAAVVVRGEGARWKGAKPDIAPPSADPPQGLRSTGWLRPEWRERLTANLKQNLSSRPGHCSAYAYLKLMTGEADFALSSRIHPWDHAAGALILEELGGRTAFLADGAAYGPRDSIDAPLLATAPGRDWSAISRRLLD
ncbi:MAG: inositol monophosphatase family protein [Parvularculaceae bacterium]